MHPSPPKTAGARTRKVIATALIALGAVLLAGCAEDRSNLLPGDTVKEISLNLDRVRELADQGDCTGAVDAAQQVTRQIEGLGTSVDPKLRRSLRDGASRLVLTIQAGCGGDQSLIPTETAPVDPTVEPDTGGTEPDPGSEQAPVPEPDATGDEPGTGGNGNSQDNGSGGPETGDGSGTGTGGGSGGGSGGNTGGGTGGSTGGVGPPGG